MNFRRMAIPAMVVLAGALSAPLGQAAAAGPQDRGYGRGGWDAPPQELNALQRQGFHDGIEGARRDVENHRRPDVENREEYRNPHLPPRQRGAYR